MLLRARELNMDTKSINKQGEGSSLSDVSTATTSSPGRARRVSMKIKKGLKEVKEILSHHHLHHHHGQHPDEHGHGDQRRRKPGPNESRRGPLAPVLDRLERDKSVPIHLHISRTGSFSVTRKGSSSSYSCSDIAPDESKTLADIHQHTHSEEKEGQRPVDPEPEPEPQLQQPEPQLEPAAMEVPVPYVAPPSPQRSDDGEKTPNPFLVDDPEDPLSEPESSATVLAPPLVPAPESLPPLPEAPLSESVALSPELPQLAVPPEPAAVDKPVPALPVSSETESEPEAPTVYLPQLVLPTMFLPIPNVRISSYLTWWLTRRVPTYY
ncbi:hypothetical protein BJV74DRAFT_332706 [Russula compacta]|nr:hypothetical protein BJV74DRAFT_332706 [Russula compacta]